MPYIIAGLGNPGEEYENTRHNTGRMMLMAISGAKDGFDSFEFDKRLNAFKSEIKIGKEKVSLIAPQTFMNNSGKSLAPLVKNVKSAEKLIVIYDDFNLPLGRIKISFNRSSGGHNGVESVIKSLKTEAFLRIRVGMSPANSKGVAKVPHGEDKIEKFILGKFKSEELKILKKTSKQVVEAVEVLVKEGVGKAMSMFNS